MDFELDEANLSDVDDLALIMAAAFRDDDLFKNMVHHAAPGDAHAWIRGRQAIRFQLPDSTTFVIRKNPGGQVSQYWSWLWNQTVSD